MRKLLAGVALTVTALTFIGAFSPALAVDTAIKLDNPLGATSDIPSVLDHIFTEAVKVISFVVPVIIIVAAFQMMFSAGDPEKFATGRKTILYTIIGYAILLAAKGIMAIIRSILTIN